MRRIIDKLFYLNAWSIGWRQINDQFEPPIEGVTEYHTIPISDDMYVADPFIVESADGIYLFCESMNRYRGKGSISAAKLKGDRFGAFQEVLTEPFHLSYPNVFQYDNKFFMIPETSAVGQIRLYRATNFPWKWQLDSILLDDGNAWVDSSLQKEKNDYYLLAYYEKDKKKTLRRFRLDMQGRQLMIVNTDGWHVDRPAGNSFFLNGIEYRPIQNCKDYYGQSVLLFQKDSSGNEAYVGEIKPQNLSLKPSVKNLTGTHTLNRSEHYEVVDFRFDRFCLTKRWIWLYSKLRNDRKELKQ